MPLDEFEEQLAFLDRSEINDVRLLGGEPTLHPEFPKLIELAKEKEKHITVFSNGFIPESALTSLANLLDEKCTVILNTSAEVNGTVYNNRHIVTREETIHRLGKKIMLGINLATIDLNLETVINIIRSYNISNIVRLGIALPNTDNSNRFIHPKQYPVLGKRIIEWAKVAARFGIYFDLDCGFVRCMFSDDDMRILKQGGMKPGWHCNPILDICPGGTVLHCFPLAKISVESFFLKETAKSLREQFLDQTKPYRPVGIYQKCTTCRYKKSGECTGGCIALTMKRFFPAKIDFEVCNEN
jgi:MoaA/NifB/PqqE/SkfB family radical SAM enzyme